MKKLVLFITLGLGASFAYAQNEKDNDKADEQKIREADVPAIVRAAFIKNHPQVKDAKWGKERVNYEAEFDVNKKETTVIIDDSGKVLETETEVAVSELPKAVSDYVAKNLSHKKISEAAKIIDHMGKISYEAEVGGKDYFFDDKGNLIKEE